MLEGLKVIITRPVDQGAAIVRAIRAAGGVAVHLPLIRIIEARDFSDCDRALQSVEGFQGIVFASANGVHAFFGRVKACGTDLVAMKRMVWYAVGSRTAHTLQGYGVTAVAVPATFTGAALGRLLGSQDIHGKRYLLPRGDRGREEIQDTLTALGAEVMPVVVYSTAGPDPATASALRSEIRAAGKKALLFASPSAVEEFVHLFPAGELLRALTACTVAVIGTTTAAAAANHGIPVHAIAAKPTETGLIDALASCLPAAAGG